ncbi:hypothetical protein ACFLXQ_02220, partial [Chloroflexota bacterium]
MVLAFLNFALMLLLSAGVPVSSGIDNEGSQGQIWIVFVVLVLFFLAFSSSAYGLFRHQNWGRVIFLWS